MDAGSSATGSGIAMALLASAVLGGAAWWGSLPARNAWRRGRLRARPFPEAWRRILRRRVPLVARLPPPLQQRLKGQIQVFLAEKAFIGCRGQAITDEVRVTVAAQACLLLLGDAAGDCFPALRQVLVYPAGFWVERDQHLPGGVQQRAPQALAGESWQQGQVILSWPDTLAGAADPDDGENLVLHEFAHQIDQDKGQADGHPWRARRADRRRWRLVMDAALAELRLRPSALLGDYAAQSPAELLAVATERFFERPIALADEWPALYAELAKLYRLDPRAWERNGASTLSR